MENVVFNRSDLPGFECWLRNRGVLLSKVFSYNFRHLFAVLYYKTSKHDIAKLSDVLGHGSVDTTRIYLASTGAEHLRFLNKLGLIFELICAIILLQYFVEEVCLNGIFFEIQNIS